MNSPLLAGITQATSLPIINSSFVLQKVGRLKKLTKILPRKMFVDKIDEDTVAKIAEQVYSNEDKKAEEYFCMWSAKIDQKEQEIEEKKTNKKKSSSRLSSCCCCRRQLKKQIKS